MSNPSPQVLYFKIFLSFSLYSSSLNSLVRCVKSHHSNERLNTPRWTSLWINDSYWFFFSWLSLNIFSSFILQRTNSNLWKIMIYRQTTILPPKNNVCCHITVLRLVLVKSRMWDTQLMTCILKLLFWLCTCKKTFVTIYSQRLLCIYVIKINILHYIILFKYNMKYLFHTFFFLLNI